MIKLSKEKFLYIFLLINSFLWICVELFRKIISIDAMEAVVWGELADFGTNKHPPFSGWLMAAFYNIFGQYDFLAYILGQLCLIIGLIFIYKFSKFFLSEEKSICASMIMTVCYYYTYTVFIDNYNCNILLMGIIPAIGYYYYKAIKDGKTFDWILFGFLSGIAFLTKYQIVFFFLALFLHLCICEKKQFLKWKGVYIAALIGSMVIAPHIIWLYKYDFFSFSYMVSQATGLADESSSIMQRLIFPLKFVTDQILSLIVCFIVYGLLAIYAKNISIGNKDGNISDKILLLSICFVPAVAQGLMGAFTGNMLHGVWGSIMVSFSGIAMFYFLPIEFKKDEFKYFIKTIIAAIILILLTVVIVSQVQTKRQFSYPYKTVLADFHRIWDEKTNNAELKYVGGNIGFTAQFRIYDETRPNVILESFGYKSPWYNHEDIINSGILVIAKSPEKLLYRTKDAVHLLPEEYEIPVNEYKFTVKNCFGKEKDYTIYYTVIPPKNDA